MISMHNTILSLFTPWGQLLGIMSQKLIKKMLPKNIMIFWYIVAYNVIQTPYN